MDFSALQQMTQKELDQFKVVCNQLLSRTFVVRSVYRPSKGTVNNPDYNFLALHYEAVRNFSCCWTGTCGITNITDTFMYSIRMKRTAVISIKYQPRLCWRFESSMTKTRTGD